MFFHPLIDGKVDTIDSIPTALNATKTQFYYTLSTVIFSIAALGSVASRSNFKNLEVRYCTDGRLTHTVKKMTEQVRMSYDLPAQECLEFG